MHEKFLDALDELLSPSQALTRGGSWCGTHVWETLLNTLGGIFLPFTISETRGWTDANVMWLRNPFPMLRKNEGIDLQISTDRFNGNEWSAANPINTGFYMIRSNKKTISLFDAWYARKNNSTRLKKQDVLVNMLHEDSWTNNFSGFCQNSKDFRAVRTVHANCCLTINAKVVDLMAVIHDWERFKTNETSTTGWSSHVACQNSWKSSTRHS
ncbi:Nucleotide-diphospho-sugar transferase protein [Fagus crenata]